MCVLVVVLVCVLVMVVVVYCCSGGRLCVLFMIHLQDGYSPNVNIGTGFGPSLPNSSQKQ